MATESGLRPRNFKNQEDGNETHSLSLFSLLIGWLGTDNKKPLPGVPAKTLTILKDTIDFAKQIQPILVKNCSPCHFTGGKMYEKLPFDKDTTIINHQAAILKRIKGEENALIKAFVEQKTKQ